MKLVSFGGGVDVIGAMMSSGPDICSDLRHSEPPPHVGEPPTLNQCLARQQIPWLAYQRPSSPASVLVVICPTVHQIAVNASIVRLVVSGG